MGRKISCERLSAMTAASRSTGMRARGVLVFVDRLVVACALQAATLALGACVVPIPAEPAEDAGPGKNGYPVISDVIPAMPGPLVVDKNPDRSQSVTLSLDDADLGDTLYLRIFRDPDLGNVLAVRDKVIPPGGDEERTLVTDTKGWCDGASTTQTHVYDAVVGDRPWVDSREVAAGGKTSTRSWLVQCIETP
jgi:hypothetical protein